MTQALTNSTLESENRIFSGTGGVSQGNRALTLTPGFLDRETGSVYLSRTTDGKPASVHLIEGLPEALVIARTASGGVSAVKGSVEAGFVCDGHFYTRAQAASLIGSLSSSLV